MYSLCRELKLIVPDVFVLYLSNVTSLRVKKELVNTSASNVSTKKKLGGKHALKEMVRVVEKIQ